MLIFAFKVFYFQGALVSLLLKISIEKLYPSNLIFVQ